MSDLVRQLAEERRKRYEQLQAEDRPKVDVCPHCHEASYLKEVCPATGLFHNMAKKSVLGRSDMDGKFINTADLMGAIERTRIKWSPSRTQLVKADADALNIFQSFISQMEWGLQRYGILYGQYDEKTATVEAHAVYEPEQHGNSYLFELLDDPRIAKVDRIAQLLGLRRVGVICSHPPRDMEKIVLSVREMLLCAREQSRFGDECVLLTVSPSTSGERDGLIECQAWQTSSQCIYLYRMGMLHEPTIAELRGAASTNTDPATGGVTTADPLSIPEEARLVGSTVELEVAQEDRDSQGRQRFTAQAPSKLVDTRWFTSYIAVQQFSSGVVRSLFMRISRPGMAPPTFQNLKNYLQDPKRRNASFAEKIADFHVLVFLAEVFSIEDDLPTLAEAAQLRVMTDEARNYEAILAEYLH